MAFVRKALLACAALFSDILGARKKDPRVVQDCGSLDNQRQAEHIFGIPLWGVAIALIAWHLRLHLNCLQLLCCVIQSIAH